jgi:hypothetical protein
MAYRGYSLSCTQNSGQRPGVEVEMDTKGFSNFEQARPVSHEISHKLLQLVHFYQTLSINDKKSEE